MKIDASTDTWERLIDKHIHHERNRGLLKRRLIDGVTFEMLAEEFGLSVRQTKNIVYSAEKYIIEHEQ